MPRRPRSLSLLVLLALAPILLGACGSSHSRVTTGTYAGENGAGAPYLNVGPLVYEVQISRQLNPYDTEDMNYLRGLTPAQRALSPGEEWFGVFLQVYNETDRRLVASNSIDITDTQKNVYRPLSLPRTNVFAYHGGAVPGKGQLPVPGTPERAFGTQGELLLFKIPVVALDNRPLELRIADPENPARSASAELDV